MSTADRTAAQDLLARYKTVTGISTNYAVAKRLGVSINAVDQWERGGGMDVTPALQIAEELDLPPLPILARVRRDRAKSDRERALWDKYCARVLVAAMVALLAGHQFRDAHHEIATIENVANLTTYTLCARQRRR